VNCSEYDRPVAERVTHTARLPQLGRTLASAYESNPLLRWMFAEDLSQSRLEGLFTSLVEFGFRYGLVYGSADSNGASIWFPPIGDDRYAPDQPAPDVEADTAAWSSGRRAEALEALASNRPTQPHFYLDAVGVVPGSRRQGIASSLLGPTLAECDATGTGAYLENSDPANASLYARNGFEERGQILMPESAPPIVAMWRRPR
jgi:GNAT superfamily N-acetyltransferase